MHRLVRLGALQEAAVTASGLVLGVTGGPAELRVDVHHGCSGDGHVGDHDTGGEGLGRGHEHVQPVVGVLGPLRPHIADHALHLGVAPLGLDGRHHGSALLGLHEAREGVEGQHLQGGRSLLADLLHRSAGIDIAPTPLVRVVPHLLRGSCALLLADALTPRCDEHVVHLGGHLRLRLRVHRLQALRLEEELQLRLAVLGLEELQELLLGHLQEQQVLQRGCCIGQPQGLGELEHGITLFLPELATILISVLALLRCHSAAFHD
mmetsp:Transcript_28377/g.61190  ORF Transcript_28377/g.61190 Transcript_28377/m.61190 type:complete len:264 (+) Transcript_28377:871-1662(+)